MISSRNVISIKTIFITVFAFLQFAAFVKSSEISHISSDETKRLGDKVEFNCTVNNPKNSTLLWIKINKNSTEQFILATNTYMIIRNQRFFVNYDNKSSTYTLKIKNLKANDAGLYQCQIVVDMNEKVSAGVKLELLYPPKIIRILPDHVSVFEGDSLNLACQADGYPIPHIVWERKNNDILPFGGVSYNGNVLKIANISKIDRGIYNCIAKNEIEPAAQASVKVNVEFSPTVYAVRPKIGQAIGGEVKLQCQVEAFPIPDVTWLKNDDVIITDIPRVSTDEFVHTHHVNVIGPNDYGYYTCRARNKHGEGKTVIELFKTNVSWSSSD